ncbi:MAG: hypothetical protein K2K21_02810 [Lachnospiraceae bacterium]|nr:hypothetical protein [Lachnospiraceae bacterium]
MAKVKTKIYNDYCPQALFLYGTKQEDGQPHFKDLIRKNGVFSANQECCERRNT